MSLEEQFVKLKLKSSSLEQLMMRMGFEGIQLENNIEKYENINIQGHIQKTVKTISFRVHKNKHKPSYIQTPLSKLIQKEGRTIQPWKNVPQIQFTVGKCINKQKSVQEPRHIKTEFQQSLQQEQFSQRDTQNFKTSKNNNSKVKFIKIDIFKQYLEQFSIIGFLNNKTNRTPE